MTDESPPATPEEAVAAGLTEAESAAASDAAAGKTVDIVTPTGGESVTEGTILEWSVKVGDAVKEGDTVVEISTDKVDMELPAPASGTITEILFEEGATVTVGQVIARMTAGAATDGAADPGARPVRPQTPQPGGVGRRRRQRFPRRPAGRRPGGRRSGRGRRHRARRSHHQGRRAGSRGQRSDSHAAGGRPAGGRP